ncbi:hypothetical protein Salat_1702000 [Sesamum alatum]|uniref:Zinc knuckle CX2CX4HX4C domain-containing protein n=1 Tax=Sesamum alatum TaxID=300844 RepID=A0AAE1Y816_9LAMI|nr:hypothetical protein Salat_1702000 [Sesamum alatum]
MDLQWCDFTDFPHEVPYEQLTRAMAEFTENTLGRFRDVDWYGKELAPTSNLKILIGLKVQNPLHRFMKIKSPEGGELTIRFTYARLPNFRFLCGLLGLISKYCDVQFTDDFCDPGPNMLYEPWMRYIRIPWSDEPHPTDGLTNIFPTAIKNTLGF